MTEHQDNTAHLLAAIVESSDDAIVSKDLSGIVRTWNRAAERMFGYTSAEMVGQSIRKIIPADRQHEEDRVLASVMAGQPVDHFETLRKTRNGELIPISLMVSPVRDASGKVIGASKIARDISDRKRAEAQAERIARRDAFLAHITLALTQSLDYKETLRTLAALAVPNIADFCAVDIVNAEGELVRLAVTHVDPGKVRLAEDFRERYEDPQSSTSPHHVLRTRTPKFIRRITDEMIVASAKGDEDRASSLRTLGLVSYMCLPMVAHNRALGVLTLANAESRTEYGEDDLRLAEDVAARAALAIENAQSYQEAQSANRLKDEFLATLSHELRTPLNAVLGYARMLRSGAIRSERAAHAHEVIERNAEALAQIVEDVLDVSRIISGKAFLDLRPTDVATVVKDATATVRPTAEAKGLRLELALADNVGPVAGDPNRLQQVVWNLLSNAVKFTPRGGHIRVQVEAVADQAELVVTDTGIGLSSEFLPHVFERFRQAEGGPTRRHGGLGLGLAIARHIVEMHGGTIEASSDGPGQGATFRVKLPTISDQESDLGDARSQRGRPRAEQLDLIGIRVLAVDDDADALQLVREILESAGADVIAVTSAGAALDCLASQRPHVVVTDLSMPDMDGFELIEQIRKLTDAVLRRVPAAALTAYARSADRTRALRSGFEMHLAKPVDAAELVAAVGSLAKRDGA
jgi:PAS domain S-box-containing protein